MRIIVGRMLIQTHSDLISINVQQKLSIFWFGQKKLTLWFFKSFFTTSKHIFCDYFVIITYSTY